MSYQPSVAGDLPGNPAHVPRRFQLHATHVILALNVVIFVLMERAGGLTNLDVLLNFGAAYGPYFKRGEYWRLVMPMFLHGGWVHLLINSYALFIVGLILEQVYGYGRFAFLYVTTGIASAFVSMEFSKLPAVGASGAIFGILGIMLVTGFLHRDSVPPRWRRAFGRGIVPVIALNLLLGFSIQPISRLLNLFFDLTIPKVDNWAHLGGLVSGAVLAVLMPPPRLLRDSFEERPSQAIVVVPVAVVALALAVTGVHYRQFRSTTTLLVEGERFRAAGESEHAFERFREAAGQAPTDERPHEELGALYLSQGQKPEAIREYLEAVRLSPDSEDALLGLAQAYQQTGDAARAGELIRKVEKNFPRSAEGHYVFAALCQAHKLYPDAIKHFEQALTLKPDMPEAHNDLAWLYATSDDVHFRDPRQALEHARRAVELSKWKEASFIDTLAEALYANGNFAEAVKVQTRALELDPRNRELEEHMDRYRKAAGASPQTQ